MSGSAISLFVFAIYMILGGLGFAFIPNVSLELFGLPATQEPWVRIVGALMVALGYYYLQVARKDIKPFYVLTVQARVGVFLIFMLFILLGWAPLTLAMFAAIDLLGAIWTYLTLRARVVR